MALRIIMLLLFVALLALPFAFRGASQSAPRDDDRPQLIIITPHNEQIRYEFARAFERWNLREFRQEVSVVYSVPGGTSEIRKMLESQVKAALASNLPIGGNADIIFGGGSSEFNRMKAPLSVPGVERTASILAPLNLDQEFLDTTYGENRVADTVVYDPDKYWFGAALSAFGLVYNNHLLAQLQVDPPTQWADLAHPRLLGRVALVNPAQSGSISTAFEAILKQKGWTAGWQILRRAAANARYFSGSSLKPPIDVTQGDAAIGVCIDFYGRFQSQAVALAGDPLRLGYIDPPGESTIDPDPIALLNGAPSPVLAERFIRFCLSPQGQSLWQYRVQPADAGPDALGPRRFELRRLPVNRALYQPPLFANLIDQVNPYDSARPSAFPDAPFREFVAPLFVSMAMDCHHELRDAWSAIITHPAYPRQHASARIISAADVADPTLKRMLELFDALPSVPGPHSDSSPLAAISLDSAQYALSADQSTKAFFAALNSLRTGWLRGQWASAGLWPPQASPADEFRRTCTRQFTANYREILRLASQPSSAAASAH